MFFNFLLYFERFVSENIPICVVFDGVKPPNKAMTLSTRRQQYVSIADEILTSATMNNLGSRELFTRKVMIESLQFLQRKYSQTQVIIHCALGEGDAEVIRMAQHLHAYAVIGNDYDHVVLLSSAPDIAFVPIDNISFRGTEFRSFPCWDYKKNVASSSSEEWIELSKEDCVLLDSAHKRKNEPFSVHLSNDMLAVQSDPDIETGYMQYEIRFKTRDNVFTRRTLRQPNILVLRYDIHDICLGLGLEEGSLPAFATLVGCDFLPGPVLKDFHSYIGTLRRQGASSDIIPAVASLVRQHADWSYLNPSSVSFPFDESFFARAVDGSHEISPQDMCEMAKASVGFFTLRRDPQEYMLGAALLLTGLFPSFQGGLVEARVAQCLVHNSDHFSMPQPMELSDSNFHSNVNVQLYPLMRVVIALLERLGKSFFRQVMLLRLDEELDIVSEHRLLESTQIRIATVLKSYDFDSILDVTRRRRGKLDDVSPNSEAAASEIYQIMHQFYSICDSDASQVLNVSFDAPVGKCGGDSTRRMILDTLSIVVEGNSTTRSSSVTNKRSQVVKYYNDVWNRARCGSLLETFTSLVGEEAASDADFFDLMSLFSVLCCGYTDVWGGDNATALLIRAYLICMILKSGRIDLTSEEKPELLDSDHTKALCLHLNVSSSHDQVTKGFSSTSESSRVQSMLTALSTTHLLINQSIELIRVVPNHSQPIEIKPSFVDLVDGRLLHFVHNEIIKAENSFDISDFLVDTCSQNRFHELYNFFTVEMQNTLHAAKHHVTKLEVGRQFRKFGHVAADSNKVEESSDSDNDDDDSNFNAEYTLKHSRTGEGGSVSVRNLSLSLTPPLRHDGGNVIASSTAARRNMQSRFGVSNEIHCVTSSNKNSNWLSEDRKELPQWKIDMRDSKIKLLKDKGDEWSTAVSLLPGRFIAGQVAPTRMRIISLDTKEIKQENYAAAAASFQQASREVGFSPHKFQQDAFDIIGCGNSLLAVAPTGAGKTHIALNALYQALCFDRKKAALVCPTKALVNQSYSTIWSHFDMTGCENALGIHTLDLSHNADNPKVLVTVAQSFLNMLLKGKKFDVVVLDEFHSILDEKDGYVWESIVNLLPPTTQLVCLTATLPNTSSVHKWLRTIHPSTEIIKEGVRKVKQELYTFARGGLSMVPQSCLNVYANDSRGKVSTSGLDLSAQAIRWERKSIKQVVKAVDYDRMIGNQLPKLVSAMHNAGVTDVPLEKYHDDSNGTVGVGGLFHDTDGCDASDDDESIVDATKESSVLDNVEDLIRRGQYTSCAEMIISFCHARTSPRESDVDLCLDTIQRLHQVKCGILSKYSTECSVEIDLVRDTGCCLALLLLYAKLPDHIMINIKSRSPLEAAFSLSWQSDQMCRVLIDLSLRCGYYRSYMRNDNNDEGHSPIGVIKSVEAVRAVMATSKKLRRLSRVAAIEVKEYWQIECLRPIISVNKRSKTRNVMGKKVVDKWAKSVTHDVETEKFECFVGMMGYLFATGILAFEDIDGLKDIVTKKLLSNEGISIEMYCKLCNVPAIAQEVDAELEAVKCLLRNFHLSKAVSEICMVLAMRLVRSRNSGWIICKRILPECVMRLEGGNSVKHLTYMLRIIMLVDNSESTQVHTALSNMLDMSTLGRREREAILGVLSGNSDIVEYLRNSFTPGSVSGVLLNELIQEISNSKTPASSDTVTDLNVLLNQWNTCHRPLHSLIEDFFSLHAVTALDLLSILEDLCTNSVKNCKPEELQSDRANRDMALSLGNMQRHEAISVSFYLLEAYQASADNSPPLSENMQVEVARKGKALHQLMLQYDFEKFIRLKLILAFDLNQQLSDYRSCRSIYKKSLFPVFGKHVVKEKGATALLVMDEGEDDNEDDMEKVNKVGELQPLKDNWFDSDESDDDLDLEVPPLCRRQESAKSAVSDIGHEPFEKEGRMYMHWACDVVMRQSQRASYFNTLQDENCNQLINYMMSNHPHPQSDSQVESSSSGCMLPALIFTFEKNTASEMATKMVDIYKLDVLAGQTNADVIRKKINDAIDQVEESGKNVVPPFLKRALVRGMGVHHSAISSSCRDLVERLFNTKLIKIVFNTSSLAEGVHMPCQTVVFLQDKHNLVDNKLFRQCAGRAGRQGDSSVGFVIVTGNYTINRLQTLLKGMDGESGDAAAGEYAITDAVATSTSMLLPAARLNLLGRDNFSRIPLCLTENRNFNHQMRKVDYVLAGIREMMGGKSVPLCVSSVEVDIRLRPLYAFVVRIFVSQLRDAFQEAGKVMDETMLRSKIRELVNLILWFRKPIESRAYRIRYNKFHCQDDYHRSVPLLDSFPEYLRCAIVSWNQHIFQSLFLAEEGNLLAFCDAIDGSSPAERVISSIRSGGRVFGEKICEAQLLLESERVVERVPPAVDGLSGHAFALVASGVNKNNMSTLFAIPYDALPFLDPEDIAVKSKQGFLLHFIFSKSKESLTDTVEKGVMYDRVKVKYGVDKYALNRELGDIRSALKTIMRFTDTYIPFPKDMSDPVRDVISGALERIDCIL